LCQLFQPGTGRAHHELGSGPVLFPQEPYLILVNLLAIQFSYKRVPALPATDPETVEEIAFPKLENEQKHTQNGDRHEHCLLSFAECPEGVESHGQSLV